MSIREAKKQAGLIRAPVGNIEHAVINIGDEILEIHRY